MEQRDHWENIYSTKAVDDVSWFREHLGPSLELIEAAQLKPDAHIIDVGGGASTLVDDLLEKGFEQVTVLDISQAALDKTKERLGDRASAAT
jgi:ubiquinone/menaquinone biosynthesis C-methylase UbiE